VKTNASTFYINSVTTKVVLILFTKYYGDCV